MSGPKRVKVKVEYATNVFFERVLGKLHRDALAEGKGSQHTYFKALKSLKKYPLELKNAWEGKSVVEGLGEGTCLILDRSLTRCTALHGSITLEMAKCLSDEQLRDLGRNTSFAKSHRGPPLPVKRKKSDSDVVDGGNSEAPTSSTAPRLTTTQSFPPAKKLKTCGSLGTSDAGMEVMRRGSDTGEGMELYPGDFEIKLVVDNGESGIGDIEKVGLDFERRRLSAGDFAWIARHKTLVEKEVLLDYIVERKRLDDLASSICENRYRDQKVRLRECGIKNRIFLVELSDKSNLRLAVPLETLKQAMLNTQIQENFYLKITRDARGTAVYLKALTAKIRERFSGKTLRSQSCDKEDNGNFVSLMPFKLFQNVAAKWKPLTVKELFARQLMVIKGMTMEKASGIVSRHPTFSSLFNASQSIQDPKQRPAFLAGITFGSHSKKIGQALSASVAQFLEAMLD